MSAVLGFSFHSLFILFFLILSRGSCGRVVCGRHLAWLLHAAISTISVTYVQ